MSAHIHLAASYSLLGPEGEARAEATEVLTINLKFSLEHLAKTTPFKDQAHIERFIDALHKARVT